MALRWYHHSQWRCDDIDISNRVAMISIVVIDSNECTCALILPVSLSPAPWANGYRVSYLFGTSIYTPITTVRHTREIADENNQSFFVRMYLTWVSYGIMFWFRDRSELCRWRTFANVFAHISWSVAHTTLYWVTIKTRTRQEQHLLLYCSSTWTKYNNLPLSASCTRRPITSFRCF